MDVYVFGTRRIPIKITFIDCVLTYDVRWEFKSGKDKSKVPLITEQVDFELKHTYKRQILDLFDEL